MSEVITPAAATPAARAPWTPPTVSELPRLTELTLQTGNGVGATGTGTGSTVF